MDQKRWRTMPANPFDGVRTFSATMARDREMLGDKITDWIKDHPHEEIVDVVVTQSSDEAFHCLAITLFFRHAAAS
jgi:hypothetical protein